MASLTFKLGGHLWELDLPVWTVDLCVGVDLTSYSWF